MERKIRSELLKMTVIMLVLAGLGIYAHEFVISGIKAKVALNLSIFALFGVAAFLAFRHVVKLNNEVLALKALQVDYGSKSRRPLDPYKHPAIVFQEPELLGQGYRLIAEELSKADALQISNATVQTLLHDVDQRINDRKSTIIYFSGLMVFLGLLGAFMGLMKTVGSVGDLIGGMDISGGGGTDSFGKLIDGMKAPLNGMSVGFSSSLFGLMTSMVLGALERCMTSAMKTLRNEFEHWLSNVAALEAPQAGEGGGVSGRAMVDLSGVIRALESGSKQIRELRESHAGTGRHHETTQYAIAEMAQAVTRLSRSVDKVTDPGPMLQPIADCVAELARNQTLMVSQFHGLFNLAERDRAHIREMLETLKHSMERQRQIDGPQLHTQLDRMIAQQHEMLEQGPPTVSLSGLVAESGAPVMMVPTGNGGPVHNGGLLSRLVRRVGLGRSGGSGTSELRRERRQLRSEILRMLMSQRKMMRTVERSLGTTVEKVEAGRMRDQDLLARMLAQNDANQARLAVLMDRLQMVDEAAAGDGKDMHLLTGLHGARLEMDVLRRRLNVMQERDGQGNEAGAPFGAPGTGGSAQSLDGTNG